MGADRSHRPRLRKRRPNGALIPRRVAAPGRWARTCTSRDVRDARRALRSGRPRIGCSGWNYASWQGRFYPRELPRSRWLAHYAGTFDTVEVNNTFYRLPEASIFASWRAQTRQRS
jgi:hypothetical protein